MVPLKSDAPLDVPRRSVMVGICRTVAWTKWPGGCRPIHFCASFFGSGTNTRNKGIATRGKKVLISSSWPYY